MRGSVTLPLRIRKHLATAQKVAAFLDAFDRITYVYYKGMASHSQHKLARHLRSMTNFRKPYTCGLTPMGHHRHVIA